MGEFPEMYVLVVVGGRVRLLDGKGVAEHPEIVLHAITCLLLGEES